MNTSAIVLKICCEMNIIIPSISILNDYFGIKEINNENILDNFENINIIMNIYKGLFNMNVDTNRFDESFRFNQLDDFIHIYYSEYDSDNNYYKLFCEKDIKIGKTNNKNI